jgi:hypothetical protein
MATLNVNAENAYKKGFEVLLQQTASKFRPLVTVEEFGNAEEFYINQIGSTTIASIADLSAASIFTSTTTSRRQITKAIYAKNELILDDQLNDMSWDPKSAIVQNTIRAVARQMDAAIITAAQASANTGKAGATAVAFPAGNTLANGGTNGTYAKLLTGVEFFLDNNFEGERLTHVISPKVLSAYMGINQIIDGDFSRLHQGGIAAPMNNGYAFTLNLGVKVDVFVSTQLNVATNIADTLLFSKNGIGLGIGKDVSVKIAPNPERNMQEQITTIAIFGASRLDEEQVYVIECDETA